MTGLAIGSRTPPPDSPFGDHRTAREAVFASQRGRLLEGMIEAVAEKGYAATTIADVVARARVSRRTFYEHFEDKEDAFVATLDLGYDFVFARIEHEFAAIAADDWRAQVRTIVATYLETLAAEPRFARVVHLDAMAAGDRARDRWFTVLRRFTDFYRERHELARSENGSVPAVGDEILLAMVGGVADVARDYLRRGEPERLPELAPSLARFAEGVIAGEWRA